MLQAVKRNRGGTIEAHFLGVRPASVTVSLYTGDGGVRIDAQAATLDSVNTTLSAGAAARATTVALTSAASVVTGRRYLLGTVGAAEAPEAVTVKSLSGTTATLWAPLMRAHSSGAAFAGTRASYAVTADQAASLWFDGYADWTPASGEVVTEVVDCALRPFPAVIIDETDLRRVFPKAPMILDAEQDMPAALTEARDQFLIYFGGKNRAHCALGVDHFRRPCALMFWKLRRHSLGSEWQAQMEEVDKELDFWVEKLQSQIPFDNDQDGKTTGVNDGGYTSIRLERM